jgi:4'-phosphopantetheinyl transferase
MPALPLPEAYRLPNDEIHIWQTRLDLSVDHITGLTETLSFEEQQRAERFRIDSDRKRHIIGRGLARLVIASVLNTRPQLLKIVSSSLGKPHLLRDGDRPPVDFNISHSGDLIYLAVARERAVGIDVEKAQTNFALETLARDVFSTVEFRELTALDPALRADGFFTCWTRKEALAKAMGKGVSDLPELCNRSLFGRLTMPLSCADPDGGPAASWTLSDLPVDAGYKAALAYEGIDCVVRRWEWP